MINMQNNFNQVPMNVPLQAAPLHQEDDMIEDPNQEFMTEVLNISKIKEGFYIGDKISAVSIEVVIQFKLTHMINASGNQIINQWESISMRYLTLNWSESPNQILFDPNDEIADKIVFFIEDSFINGEGLLAHSFKGQDRVCIVVLIYLIKKYKWSLKKSFEYLKSKKQDVDIPPYFLSQLIKFEGRLIQRGELTKDIPWSFENLIDPEEKLLRNTYLNGLFYVNQNGETIKKLPQDKNNKKQNIKHIMWADFFQGQPIEIVDLQNDLFLQKDIKPVYSHQSFRPSKACIKGKSKKLLNNTMNNSIKKINKINNSGENMNNNLNNNMNINMNNNMNNNLNNNMNNNINNNMNNNMNNNQMIIQSNASVMIQNNKMSNNMKIINNQMNNQPNNQMNYMNQMNQMNTNMSLQMKKNNQMNNNLMNNQMDMENNYINNYQPNKRNHTPILESNHNNNKIINQKNNNMNNQRGNIQNNKQNNKKKNFNNNSPNMSNEMLNQVNQFGVINYKILKKENKMKNNSPDNISNTMINNRNNNIKKKHSKNSQKNEENIIIIANKCENVIKNNINNFYINQGEQINNNKEIDKNSNDFEEIPIQINIKEFNARTFNNNNYVKNNIKSILGENHRQILGINNNNNNKYIYQNFNTNTNSSTNLTEKRFKLIERSTTNNNSNSVSNLNNSNDINFNLRNTDNFYELPSGEMKSNQFLSSTINKNNKNKFGQPISNCNLQKIKKHPRTPGNKTANSTSKSKNNNNYDSNNENYNNNNTINKPLNNFNPNLIKRKGTPTAGRQLIKYNNINGHPIKVKDSIFINSDIKKPSTPDMVNSNKSGNKYFYNPKKSNTMNSLSSNSIGYNPNNYNKNKGKNKNKYMQRPATAPQKDKQKNHNNINTNVSYQNNNNNESKKNGVNNFNKNIFKVNQRPSSAGNKHNNVFNSKNEIIKHHSSFNFGNKKQKNKKGYNLNKRLNSPQIFGNNKIVISNNGTKFNPGKYRLPTPLMKSTMLPKRSIYSNTSGNMGGGMDGNFMNKSASINAK